MNEPRLEGSREAAITVPAPGLLARQGGRDQAGKPAQCGRQTGRPKSTSNTTSSTRRSRARRERRRSRLGRGSMACTATTTPATAAQNRSETGQSLSAANYNVFGHLLDESIVQSGGNPRGHCLFTGDARGLDSKRSGRPVGAVRTARKPPTSACFLGANFGAISYNFIAYSLIVSDAQPNGSRHVHHPCTGDAHGLDLQRSGRPVGAVRTAQKPPTSACLWAPILAQSVTTLSPTR